MEIQTASKNTRKALRGTKIGQVTSDCRSKTCTVVVAYQTRHAKYGKYIWHKSRYQVHDPDNISLMGDRVEIARCRPISKTKMWRLVRVIKSVGDTSVAQLDAE